MIANYSIENPLWSMALEEALFASVGKEASPNTVRLWVNAKAVVIGRYQCVRDEITRERCLVSGTSIVRRFSGGGTVYQDEGNLNFSVFVHTDLGIGAKIELFENIGKAVVALLKHFGITATLYDSGIFVGSKKISGFAGAISKGVVLVHGCLLVRSKLDLLYSVLNFQKRRESRFVRSRLSKVTSMSEELGFDIGLSDVGKVLIAFFCDSLRIAINEGKVSSEERTLAGQLFEHKYLKEAWVYATCRQCPERVKDLPRFKALLSSHPL